MLADQPEQPGTELSAPAETEKKNWRRWLRWLLSLGLTAITIWYISRDVDLAEVGQSLRNAALGWVVLGLLIIGLTGLAKAWRWQQLFSPRQEAPAFRHLFWSLLLGQFLNLALWRFGDLARVYDLNQRTGRSKTLILSTIVVEKSLHLLFVLLTLLLFLPFIVLPMVRTPVIATTWVVVPLLAVFYLLSYQTDLIIRLSKKVGTWLPAPLEARLLHMAISGLEGLAALRDRRAVLMLLFSSVLIALLEITTPYVIFLAFDLPFGFVEAVVLNIALGLGFVAPSTPLKIGVFEWLTIFVLRQFANLPDSLGLSYALVFHGVVILPTIILGFMATVRSRWRWPRWPG